MSGMGKRTVDSPERQRPGPILYAAIALTVIQVVHALIPAETDAEGFVGLIAGLVALSASLTSIYGLRLGKPWAPTLTGITGLSIAVGFLLYHALPITSAFTNPYWGEPEIGFAQWAPVFACIGIGLWCAYEAFIVRSAGDNRRVAPERTAQT
jgi:hypothetical protein